MAEKADYSPVVEEAGDAEKRRERRKWGALLTGAHVFWIYGAILAEIILLVIYLTGGFGAGSDLPNSLDASGSGAALAKEAASGAETVHSRYGEGPRARLRVQNDAALSASN